MVYRVSRKEKLLSKLAIFNFLLLLVLWIMFSDYKNKVTNNELYQALWTR